MPQELRVYHHPHRVLQQKATKVEDIHHPHIQQLIDDMVYTCERQKGMGIAAPQVGYSLAIFILMSHPNPRYPYAPVMPVTAVINPTILEYSQEQVLDWEGCLSIPDKRGQVFRSEKIYVRYHDRDGEEVFVDYEGFIARVFQHEYDHLQGTLFFERMKEMRLFSTAEFYKIIQS